MGHGQHAALFPLSSSDGEQVLLLICKLTNIIFHSFNLFKIFYSAFMQLYCFFDHFKFKTYIFKILFPTSLCPKQEVRLT